MYTHTHTHTHTHTRVMLQSRFFAHHRKPNSHTHTSLLFFIPFVFSCIAWASATLNSFVHCWMYGYYLLAALGVKDMWWKPYLTQLQILQFVFNFTHAAYSLLFCDQSMDFPKWAGYGMIIYMTSLIVLFMNFYLKAYTAPRKSNKKKTT
jgi:GNS1/SUR4 family